MKSKVAWFGFRLRILCRLCLALAVCTAPGCATTDSAPSPFNLKKGGQDTVYATAINSENSQYASENKDADIDPAQLDLPSEIERIDIDRFFRERRTLYVNFLPLDQKFAEIHRLFGHQLVRDKEADLSLRAQLGKDLRITHWIFVFGALELHERLSDPQKTLLLEEQKAIIAHYMRTLNFIAKFMDENLKTKRYQMFLTRLYKSLAGRHLYRNVRERQKR